MRTCPKCGCDVTKEQKKKAAHLKLAEWADGQGLCRGGEWDQTMVVNEIEENAEKLIPILTAIVKAKKLGT